jgi:aminoglycoside phosphotransferase (APT) family kinase protein
VKSVVAVIEDHFDHWAGNGVGAVDDDILGAVEASPIAEIFEAFCTRELGTPAVGGLFYAASAGCVLGVQLGSGDTVVIKAYQSRWRKPFLDAVQDAQLRLARGGMPCPRPVAPATAIQSSRPNFAVVETWLPDPGMRPGGSAAARRASALGLAQQITLCSTLNDVDRFSDHPLRSDGDGLYGTPHSPLFDFERTAAGAGWIDDLASQAKEVRDRDTSPLVVAHTDWSARNVRFDEDRLLAVYDWDSLALVNEGTALGQAAMTWSVTADPGGTEFPELTSVLEYMADYEQARKRILSPGQQHAARAAAVYVLAYTARCEHSLAVQGVARADQDAARRRLAEIGTTLLNIR